MLHACWLELQSVLCCAVLPWPWTELVMRAACLLQVLRLHREEINEPLPQSLLGSHVRQVQLNYWSAAAVGAQLGSWASLQELELVPLKGWRRVEDFEVEDFEAALRALCSAAQLRRMRLVLPDEGEREVLSRIERAMRRLREARPALKVRV